MAFQTITTTPVNTAAGTFYLWAHPIAAFMATAGWVQQNDTGQIVWPVSAFNITDANGNGTTVTFTGTIAAGATPLVVGQSVIVSGTTNFGTVGAPIRFVITGGNLTTTFTALSGTNAHDAAIAANTGWALVNPIYLAAGQFTTLSVTGGVITFNFSATTYGSLRVGQAIIIAGTTGSTYDGTYVITGGTLTTTITAATGAGNVGSTACASATGIVSCLPGCINTAESTTTTFPPAISNYLYEIWKMNDGNSLSCYLRLNYGTGGTATFPALTCVVQAATDGAGGIPANTGNTGTLNAMIGNGAAAGAQTSYMSGSTNRIMLANWATDATASDVSHIINIERSHDSTGVDTTSNQYVTVNVVGFSPAATAIAYQISFVAATQTVTETKWATLANHNTATGTFQITATTASTLLSPVTPIVGAFGNPLLGLLIGKAADWTSGIQFAFTLYNSSRNYVALVNTTASHFSAAGVITYDAVPTCMIAVRYE